MMHVKSVVEHDDVGLKSVVKIGDSILNHINPRGISKHGNVQVKTFSGVTKTPMNDYINPMIQLKPDAVIIHVGNIQFKY